MVTWLNGQVKQGFGIFGHRIHREREKEKLTIFSGAYLMSGRASAVLKGVGVRGEDSMMERLRLGVLNLRGGSEKKEKTFRRGRK